MSKAKNKKEEVDDFGGAVENEQSFDTIALTIVKGEGKRRKVVEIPVNSKTLATGVPKVIYEGENLWDAKYELELNLVKKGVYATE